MEQVQATNKVEAIGAQPVSDGSNDGEKKICRLSLLMFPVLRIHESSIARLSRLSQLTTILGVQKLIQRQP
jgi:hypothetical protein